MGSAIFGTGPVLNEYCDSTKFEYWASTKKQYCGSSKLSTVPVLIEYCCSTRFSTGPVLSISTVSVLNFSTGPVPSSSTVPVLK